MPKFEKKYAKNYQKKVIKIRNFDDLEHTIENYKSDDENVEQMSKIRRIHGKFRKKNVEKLLKNVEERRQ